MNRDETVKLFRLLSKFYPNARQVHDRETEIAWSLALKRFTYEDVKCAALDYAARKRYFPNLCDILGKLAAAGDMDVHAGTCAPSPERIRRQAEWIDKFLAGQKGGETS